MWGRNEIKGSLEDAGGVPVVVIDNDRKECFLGLWCKKSSLFELTGSGEARGVEL